MTLPDKYYDWLIYKVCSKWQQSEYRLILKDLASVEFRSDIDRDRNLVEHCEYYLRDDFKDEADAHGVYVDIPYGLPVSLLEVMVVLSIKAEDIMQSFDTVDYSRWFWDMMKSSGLAFYTNYRYKRIGAMTHIEKILSRTYEPNGKGGLFYIPTIDSTNHDLREVELWYQLMWYINYAEEHKDI